MGQSVNETELAVPENRQCPVRNMLLDGTGQSLEAYSKRQQRQGGETQWTDKERGNIQGNRALVKAGMPATMEKQSPA